MKRTRGMREFLADESGPTATEYAVMLALIIVVSIAAITMLGLTVSGSYTTSNAAMFPGP